MFKVLIACASKRRETRLIGDFIAEGLRKSGVFINVLDIKDIRNFNRLKEYDAIVLDSGIYVNDLLQKMKTDVSDANEIDFERKIGGVFGNSGRIDKEISSLFDAMKNVLKMDMVNDPLILDSISSGSGARKAKQYGQKIAEKLTV
jgi:menaquinone-dependent protoporphyrinogen IX oxidase